MWKHHWKVAIRRMARQKGYVGLNLLGMAVGFASSLVIFLYLARELGYESMHERAGRIYRVGVQVNEPDQQMEWCLTQLNLGPALKAELPEVEHALRFHFQGGMRFTYEERTFTVEKAFFADSTFHEVFSFPFLFGDPSTALTQPYQLVLSAGLAEKIFGPGVNPVGEILKAENGDSWAIAGVYTDLPQQTHIRPECMASLVSFGAVRELDPDQWGNFSIYTYVLLHKGASAETARARLDGIVEKYVAVIFDQFDIRVNYRLDPIRDIHLRSSYQGEPEPVGKMEYVIIFSVVAFFLVAIAVINYVNLATARAAQRAAEVGIRKVLGAPRRQLIGQFLTESLVLAALAAFLGLGLAAVMVYFLNQTIGLNLDPTTLLTLPSLLALLVLLLLAGLGGGLYPAWRLSRFDPLLALKGKTGGRKRDYLRMALVGVQFAVTIFMLAATGVVYDQLRYIQQKDLGFERDRLVVVSLTHPDQMGRWKALRDRLRAIKGVEAVSVANSSPGRQFNKTLFHIETNDGAMVDKGIDNFLVDFEFFDAMSARLVSGRLPNPDRPTDSTEAVVVNEALVMRMGWTEPLGKKVFLGISAVDSTTILERRVIGVIKNYHHRSLYQPIDPLMFVPSRQAGQYVHIRFSGSTNGVMAEIESAWQEIFPNLPIEAYFMSQTLAKEYEAERQRGVVFAAFSLLTALIACLGLVGLTSFMAQQRTREIGIRKVLGASEGDILRLMLSEFLLLLGLALAPAWAAGAYYMQGWLESFAYHTTLRPQTFLLAGLAAAGLALLATAYHALAAARAQPGRSLRAE